MPRDPHIEIIARAVLVCGEHALVCRHPPGEYLVFPGGHVEFGEPATLALSREIREEIGLELAVGPCLGIQELLFEQRGRPRHEYTLMFHVEHPPGWNPESPPLLHSPESPKVELRWIELRELDRIDLRPALALDVLRRRTTPTNRPPGPGITWMPSSR